MELVPGLGAAPQPQQHRSRRSHERMIAAAHELLAEQGRQAVTVAEVASRAGVAVGTLYGRFGDKTGLLRAVHSAEVEDINTNVLAGLTTLGDNQELSPAQVIDGAVRVIVNVFRQRAAIVREFTLISTSEGIMQSDGSAETPIADAFRNILRARCPITAPNPLMAADVCFRIVVAACVYRTTYGPNSESHFPLDWDEFTNEMIRMCGSYLLAPTDFTSTAAEYAEPASG